MKKATVNKPAIQLVGLTTRTNNADEFHPATSKIASLVSDYFSHNVGNLILNRQNPGVTFAVYTDYESDYNGDYTYFIGEEVSSFDNVPEGLHCMTIPASSYQRFTTPSGQMPHVIINAWQEIWKMTSETLGGERSYVADFEVYDERATDPNQVEVDIYIGIK